MKRLLTILLFAVCALPVLAFILACVVTIIPFTANQPPLHLP